MTHRNLYDRVDGLIELSNIARVLVEILIVFSIANRINAFCICMFFDPHPPFAFKSDQRSNDASSEE